MVTTMIHVSIWLWVGVLLLAVGHSQPVNPAPESVQRDERKSVINTVIIEGAPEAVFDLVTTARLWTQWHPATMGVGGVTERPYRLGDRIYERGQIGKLNFQVVWKVAEYERPSRVMLHAETSPTRITYTFQPQDGSILFQRRVEYHMPNASGMAAAGEELDRLMRVQSEQAVLQLKALVERVLREEAIATP
jgi:uncharacterized protein YndB with AHSA1/START domain